MPFLRVFSTRDYSRLRHCAEQTFAYDSSCVAAEARRVYSYNTNFESFTLIFYNFVTALRDAKATKSSCEALDLSVRVPDPIALAIRGAIERSLQSRVPHCAKVEAIIYAYCVMSERQREEYGFTKWYMGINDEDVPEGMEGNPINVSDDEGIEEGY